MHEIKVVQTDWKKQRAWPKRPRKEALPVIEHGFPSNPSIHPHAKF